MASRLSNRRFNNWWMIRGENVYTVRIPFQMRLYVKGSFFSFLSLNVVPWYTTVSKKNVSFSDLSAVNFIRACKFTCSAKKATMSGLLMSHREKMSFM